MMKELILQCSRYGRCCSVRNCDISVMFCCYFFSDAASALFIVLGRCTQHPYHASALAYSQFSVFRFHLSVFITPCTSLSRLRFGVGIFRRVWCCILPPGCALRHRGGIAGLRASLCLRGRQACSARGQCSGFPEP